MSPTVSPSRDDVVARSASTVLGGPMGKRALAAPALAWLPVGVAVGLMALLSGLLGLFVQGQCRGKGWGSPNEFTHLCYSDIPVHLNSLAQSGYLIDQPVGTNLLMRGIHSLVKRTGPENLARWGFDVTAVLLVVALIAAVAAVRLLAGRRPWDAAIVALSPIWLLAGFISLDLLALALAVWGMVNVSRNRTLFGGALIGMAMCFRPLAVIFVVALVLLTIRTRTWKPTLQVVAGAVGWWALINALVVITMTMNNVTLTGPNGEMLSVMEGWVNYFGRAWTAPASYGSPWFLSDVFFHTKFGAKAAAAAMAAGWLATGGAAVATVFLPRRAPRWSNVALVLMAGVLISMPSVSVQSAMWLLPLIALAIPHWGLALTWGCIELSYAALTWLYVYSVMPQAEGADNASRGAPAWLYGVFLVLRVGVWVWVAITAYRVARNPIDDPVRAPAEGAAFSQTDPVLPYEMANATLPKRPHSTVRAATR